MLLVDLKADWEGWCGLFTSRPDGYRLAGRLDDSGRPSSVWSEHNPSKRRQMSPYRVLSSCRDVAGYQRSALRSRGAKELSVLLTSFVMPCTPIQSPLHSAIPSSLHHQSTQSKCDTCCKSAQPSFVLCVPSYTNGKVQTSPETP